MSVVIPGRFGATLQGICYGAIPGILMGFVVGSFWGKFGIAPGLFIGGLIGALLGGVLGWESYPLKNSGKSETKPSDLRDHLLDD